MYKFDTTLFADLSSYNLIDPSLSLGEVYSKAPTSVDNKPSTSNDIEAADNVSVKPNLLALDKKAFFKQLEMSFSNGIIWEAEDDNFLPNPDVEKSFYLEAINHREEMTSVKSLEKVLAEFDSWAGTPLDILSPYGDIDLGNNIFADNFEMNVPVRIYSDAEDLVFQVDAPWMKMDTFEDVVYPNKLNLKSVLSVLPVTVNSQKLKASFINGEFKLEVPKNEIVVSLESKNG